MLYLVGLGLGDVKDVTLKGLEAVKKCQKVYLEAYTSMLTVGKDALEEFYGKEIIVADRSMVEQDSDSILLDAAECDVAFLVVGDPFGATTHSDLVLRAVEKNIPYKVIHNASIMNAIGCCGLQLYSFGETVSIVLWAEGWEPDSYYDKIKANRQRGLHTLCLLDIKMKEQSIENLIKNRKIYEPPRFMTASESAEQLLEILSRRRKFEGPDDLAYDEDTICIGLARIGSDNQQIVVTSLSQMASMDLGDPLQSLIIAGHLHPLEIDMLRIFAVNKEWFENSTQQQL